MEDFNFLSEVRMCFTHYLVEFILVSCSISMDKNEQWVFISKTCCLMGLFPGFLSRPCIWHPCWSKPCGIMHWQLRLSCQNKAPLHLYWVPTCPWETKKVSGFPVDLGVKFGIFTVSMLSLDKKVGIELSPLSIF